MSWTPLEKRRSTLPLILAGPILRRVTADSVTVWTALKENISVVLEVKNSLSGAVIMKSDVTAPLKIGNRLYISCVTARAQSKTNTLQSDLIYT